MWWSVPAQQLCASLCMCMCYKNNVWWHCSHVLHWSRSVISLDFFSRAGHSGYNTSSLACTEVSTEIFHRSNGSLSLHWHPFVFIKHNWFLPPLLPVASEEWCEWHKSHIQCDLAIWKWPELDMKISDSKWPELFTLNLIFLPRCDSYLISDSHFLLQCEQSHGDYSLEKTKILGLENGQVSYWGERKTFYISETTRTMTDVNNDSPSKEQDGKIWRYLSFGLMVNVVEERPVCVVSQNFRCGQNEIW